MYRFVAEGPAHSLQDLAKYEANFPEGSSGMLEIRLRAPWIPIPNPTNVLDLLTFREVVNGIVKSVRLSGATVRGEVVDSRTARFHFEKHLGPLALLGLAIAALAVLYLLVQVFRLFIQEVGGAAHGIGTFIVIVLVLLIGGAILLALAGGKVNAGPIQIGGGS